MTIKFSEESTCDNRDSILFSTDKEGLESIKKLSGVIKSREFKYPTGEFYVHFPSSGSDIYAWGQNS